MREALKRIKTIELQQGSSREWLVHQPKEKVDNNDNLVKVIKEFVLENWEQISAFDLDEGLRFQRNLFIEKECENPTCYEEDGCDCYKETELEDYKWICNKYIREHILEEGYGSDYVAVHYYHNENDEGEIETYIFAIYDCFCPCSDRAIAKITWKEES